MLTASDSENDLPVFPFLSPASRHDSHFFIQLVLDEKDAS